MSSFSPSKFWTHLKSKFQRFNPLRRTVAQPKWRPGPNNYLHLSQWNHNKVKAAPRTFNTPLQRNVEIFNTPNIIQTRSKTSSVQKQNPSTSSSVTNPPPRRYRTYPRLRRWKRPVRFCVPVGMGRRRRSPGPFIFYLQEFLKNVQRNEWNPYRGPQLRSVTKEAAKAWKKLSQEQKEVYRQCHYNEAARIKARCTIGRSGGR